MTDKAAEADPDVLQRARAIGKRISPLQLALALVGGVVVLFVDSASEWVAYVAAGLVLGLEAAGWAVARSALRRTPSFSPTQHFAAVPLGPNERRLIAFNLFGYLAALAFLLTLDRKYAVLGGAIVAVGVLSLLRVWRRGSWLAISWVPARAPSAAPRSNEVSASPLKLGTAGRPLLLLVQRALVGVNATLEITRESSSPGVPVRPGRVAVCAV